MLSRSDESQVELVINPPAINFPANKFVTNWKPITDIFKDLHVSSGAIVRWSEHQVLYRYRFRANVKKDGSSKPTLRVEALVLNTGTWAAVPEPKKQLLSLNTSMAVDLTDFPFLLKDGEKAIEVKKASGSGAVRVVRHVVEINT